MGVPCTAALKCARGQAEEARANGEARTETDMLIPEEHRVRVKFPAAGYAVIFQVWRGGVWRVCGAEDVSVCGGRRARSLCTT